MRKLDRPIQEFEGVDPVSRRAFRVLNDVMRMNGHTLGRRFAASGAHMGQAACLRVLDAQDGVSQRDMAEFLHVSPPSITAMLQTMEKAGLVVRKTDESDQRVTRVYLTDKGRKEAAGLRSVLAEYINEVFEGVSEEDETELIRLLEHLHDNIERASARQNGKEAE